MLNVFIFILLGDLVPRIRQNIRDWPRADDRETWEVVRQDHLTQVNHTYSLRNRSTERPPPNKPSNQQTDWPLTEQPTDWPPTDQPTDWPLTDQPTDWPPSDQPTDWPPTDQPTDWPPSDQPTDWLRQTNRPTDRQQINRLTDRQND